MCIRVICPSSLHSLNHGYFMLWLKFLTRHAALQILGPHSWKYISTGKFYYFCRSSKFLKHFSLVSPTFLNFLSRSNFYVLLHMFEHRISSPPPPQTFWIELSSPNWNSWLGHRLLENNCSRSSENVKQNTSFLPLN